MHLHFICMGIVYHITATCISSHIYGPFVLYTRKLFLHELLELGVTLT